MSDENSRSIEKTIEIEATPEEVWRALADAEGLKSWFSLDARVDPGAGGSIWISWGPPTEGTAEISIWEPNRHLQSVETHGPVKMAVDYFIEAASGGRTIVRLVHSGFSASADWDDEFNTIDSGWRSLLFHLRHYLERHAGTARRLAYLRTTTGLSRPEAWAKLVGDRPLVEGSRFDWNGYQGVVQVVRAPIHFAGTVDNLDDSYLFIEIEPRETGCGPAVWLSTWGLPEADVEREQKRLEGIFGEAGFVG